jgi:hypothetical protein
VQDALDRLQALMGHASSETTSLYVHHTRDGLEAAVAANETGRSLLEAHADRRRRGDPAGCPAIRSSRLSSVDHHPDPGRAWNPAYEAWPGGPHPGQIAAIEAAKARQAMEDAARVRERAQLLLLLA